MAWALVIKRRDFFELQAIGRASGQTSHKSLRAHFIYFQIKTLGNLSNHDDEREDDDRK